MHFLFTPRLCRTSGPDPLCSANSSAASSSYKHTHYVFQVRVAASENTTTNTQQSARISLFHFRVRQRVTMGSGSAAWRSNFSCIYQIQKLHICSVRRDQLAFWRQSLETLCPIFRERVDSESNHDNETRSRTRTQLDPTFSAFTSRCRVTCSHRQTGSL